MSEGQDTEITLGTGRLLGLFFGLVVLCALFFSLGFSLGRSSVKVEAAGPAVLPPAVATDPSAKPAPGTKAAAEASTSDELTFFKAVEKSDPNPQLDKPAPADANPPVPAEASAAKPAEPSPAPDAAHLNSGPGYLVQVAAVTKQEDADALVSALRKKQYPVFVAMLPSDKLFHVQVGPFADPKDADAVRSRLLSDGYNPIVKK